VTGVRRVIVGASGSPGSLRALRHAEDLARHSDATLMPVLAWVPPAVLAQQRRGLHGWALRRRGVNVEEILRGGGSVTA